jgi:hypothetical protein
MENTFNGIDLMFLDRKLIYSKLHALRLYGDLLLQCEDFLALIRFDNQPTNQSINQSINRSTNQEKLFIIQSNII